MATIALHVSRLEAGARIEIDPTTSSAILAVMDGEGEAKIDGRSLGWRRGDAVALPAGCSGVVTAAVRSHVLVASDKPLMTALGWLRPIAKLAP